MRVIVVDDGSPERDYAKVEQICAELRQTGSADVLLLRNPKNLGRPKTRNRLLENTDAAYVAWLDAGDIWYPEKLRLQFEHLLRLRHAGRDVDRIWVSCTYHWHQSGHPAPRRIQQQVDGDQIRSLLIGSQLRAYLWTLLGTANAFRIAGAFDERMPRMQDLDYFLNFVRAGGQIEVPPSRAPLCCYFKSDIGRNAAEVHAAYKLVLSKHRPAMLRYSAAFRSELSYKASRVAERFANSNGSKLLATRYFAQAILTNPRHSTRVLSNVLRNKLQSKGKK